MSVTGLPGLAQMLALKSETVVELVCKNWGAWDAAHGKGTVRGGNTPSAMIADHRKMQQMHNAKAAAHKAAHLAGGLEGGAHARAAALHADAANIHRLAADMIEARTKKYAKPDLDEESLTRQNAYKASDRAAAASDGLNTSSTIAAAKPNSPTGHNTVVNRSSGATWLGRGVNFRGTSARKEDTSIANWILFGDLS